MPKHSALTPTAPWTEVSTTSKDWDAAEPQLLLDMLGQLVWIRVFEEYVLELAGAIAAQVGLDARFVCANLYDLPTTLEGEFDLVYTSRGVLGWLPDIRAWARVAAHFVRPGGAFYVTEIHPVAQVFENEGVGPGQLVPTYSYWSHPEPLRFEVHGSYADRDAPTDGLTEHGWDHSLGEIVTALVEAGLRIEFLHEFDFVDWQLDFLER